MMRSLVIALAFSATTCGFSAPPPLSVKNYDRTCMDVGDCAPVFFDETGCCQSGCPNLAVNVKDADRVAFDLAHSLCGMPKPSSCDGFVHCSVGRIQCINHLCELEPVFSDGGTGGTK